MYKIHNKKRYKCLVLKKDIPENCIVSIVPGKWFDKHKSEFYEYKKTCAIFKAIKLNEYLIIYEGSI